MKFAARPLFGVLALAGCVDLPEGHFLCERSSDCPRSQICVVPERRCYRDPPPDYDASTDPATPSDASADGTTERDSGGPPSDSGTELPTDAGDDAAPDGAISGDDPIPGCEPTPASQGAIFVSPSGSAASNCGSADLPCLSIGLGIERAKATNHKQVFIDTGSYDESLTLAAGMTLVGGWNHIGHSWTRQCNRRRAESVVVSSPNDRGARFEEAGVATLSTLTIRTAPPLAGASRYALFVRGAASELVLIDVIAEASAGGDGAPGAPGTVGVPAAGTCSAASGLVGAIGSAGAAAVRGVFGPDGYAPWDPLESTCRHASLSIL